MISIGEALQKRIELYEKQGEKAPEIERKDYEKRWAHGVQYFQKAINEERRKEKNVFPPISFVAVRSKIEHIRNIEDLRWFYFHCVKYQKKDGSFSKCFFGALKIK